MSAMMGQIPLPQPAPVTGTPAQWSDPILKIAVLKVAALLREEGRSMTVSEIGAALGFDSFTAATTVTAAYEMAYLTAHRKVGTDATFYRAMMPQPEHRYDGCRQCRTWWEITRLGPAPEVRA